MAAPAAAAARQAYIRNAYNQFPLARVTNPRDTLLRYDLVDIFKKYFGSKDFVKTIYYTIDWISRFTVLPTNVLSIGGFFKNMKNAISMTQVPGGLAATMRAVENVASKCWNYARTRPGEVRTAFLDLGRQFSTLASDACDGIKLFSQWIPMARYMPFVDVFSSSCTFLGSVNNFVDDGIKLAQETNPNMQVVYGFGLGMDISYMLVGAFGLLAWWLSAPVSVILIPLTVATMCSIGKTAFTAAANPDGNSGEPSKVQRALNHRIAVEQAVRRYRPAVGATA